MACHVDHNGPLISIGLPVFNGEKYIRKALDSLRAQDYENFELIISDNASTDGTGQICREYVAEDRRIRLYSNKSNIGAFANFDLVLEKASGEYFMWAGVDDYWSPDFVSTMVRELETHPDAAVAMCAIKRVLENGEPFDVVRHQGRADPSRMSTFRLAMALAADRRYYFYVYGLFRTEFIKLACPRFPQVLGADRLLTCQVAMAAKFCYVDRFLHVRTIRDEPVTFRYATEKIGRLYQDPFAIWKMSFYATSYLLRSKVIPWRRKLWIPIIILRMTLANFYNGLYHMVYVCSTRILGAQRRKALAQSFRRLWDKV